MTDKECSYNGCSEEPITTLDIDGEEVPGCSQHLDQLAKGNNGTSGDRPVLSNGEDQAAWINTTDKGKTYLSVKVEDGQYVNLFANTDLIQDALKRQHKVTQQE